MGVVQRDIIIQAPSERVFNYIADLPRHSQWAQHQIEIRQTSEGEAKVGATFSSGHVGRPPKEVVTITEIVPTSRFVFEAEGSGGRDRHFFEVRPEGSGTRLIKGFENLSLPLLMKPATPLIPWIAGRYCEKDLKRIKERLEGDIA